jgi:hypothetical protein
MVLRRKPHPLPYGLRNPYRTLKFENSQKFYVQEFDFCSQFCLLLFRPVGVCELL